MSPLSQYGQVGKGITIVVLILVVINVLTSLTWVWFLIPEVREVIAVWLTTMVLMNYFLILGIFLRRKEIIIAWLWYHGIVILIGAYVDFHNIPIPLFILTAFSVLSVYALLQVVISYEILPAGLS